MNKFHKDRIEKNIKCYHKKFKDENTYLLVYEDKYGILLRNKKSEGAFIISSEKHFLRSRNPKEWKNISFKSCMKQSIAMMLKNPCTFPADAYGLMSVILETFTNELGKIKTKQNKSKTFTCHTCNGG